jgi:dihydropteroate synthase
VNAVRTAGGAIAAAASRRHGIFAEVLSGAPSAVVMGVVNVTPDSFSDGGAFLDPGRAVAHAHRLVAEGAAILDVGGESTRPGAPAVSVKEERRRVVPVIERIVRAHGSDVVVSIDTTKSEVAAAALDAGARIVNDVSAGLADRRMLGIVARARAGIVLMHRRGTPRTMQRRTRYRDVVAEVAAHLARRLAAAAKAGIGAGDVALDPGIGFAKDGEQNLRLLRRLDRLVALGAPVVVGVSRKSFLGKILDLPVDQRMEGTIAASLLAVAAGARIVRVHDVAAMTRALRVADAIWGAA